MQTRDKFDSTLRRIKASAESSPCTGIGIIAIGERLDHRAAERMKRHIRRHVAEGRQRHIVDLSELDALDSGGLAGLISALRAVRDNGGSVDLVASTSRVTRILELTSLTRVFKVHSSLQEALASA